VDRALGAILEEMIIFESSCLELFPTFLTFFFITLLFCKYGIPVQPGTVHRVKTPEGCAVQSLGILFSTEVLKQGSDVLMELASRPA